MLDLGDRVVEHQALGEPALGDPGDELGDEYDDEGNDEQASQPLPVLGRPGWGDSVADGLVVGDRGGPYHQSDLSQSIVSRTPAARSNGGSPSSSKVSSIGTG